MRKRNRPASTATALAAFARGHADPDENIRGHRWRKQACTLCRCWYSCPQARPMKGIQSRAEA